MVAHGNQVSGYLRPGTCLVWVATLSDFLALQSAVTHGNQSEVIYLVFGNLILGCYGLLPFQASLEKL